jgi:uncharacterized phage infection (PIP) family protein YhgE
VSLLNILVAVFMIFCSTGGLVAAFNAIINRKSARATEAQSVADVATAVNNLNADLRKEVRELKEAVIELTDTIDCLRPQMKLDPADDNRLRLITNKVKVLS